jgi:hypothetical protein
MQRGRTPITSPRPLDYQTPLKYINSKRVADPEKNFIKSNKSNISKSKYETLPLNKKIEKMEQRYCPQKAVRKEIREVTPNKFKMKHQRNIET